MTLGKLSNINERTRMVVRDAMDIQTAAKMWVVTMDAVLAAIPAIEAVEGAMEQIMDEIAKQRHD